MGEKAVLPLSIRGAHQTALAAREKVSIAHLLYQGRS